MGDNKTLIPKSFAVIGAGPSGCVLAAFLAKGGYDVTFCDLISDLVDPALERGIVLDGYEQLKQPIKSVCNSIYDLADVNPDVIFVATKTTALPMVSKSISDIHKNGSYVVSWQNGIDTERELSKNLSTEWIVRAVVNYGCSLVGPAHAHVSFHHHPHYVQEMSSSSKNVAETIADVMTSCGLHTKHTDDIKSMVWRKTILNAAMNPVCAVTGLTMYEAMREAYVFNIVDSLLKECILVAEKNGVNMEEGYYEHAVDYMRNAGDHKPSMLVDVENGRITEIDYINGKFEEYGLSVGVKTPYNSVFRALIKGREFQFLRK